MKKAMFTLAILVATTSFAVNPVNVNPINKLENVKILTKRLSLENKEIQNNIVTTKPTYQINCRTSDGSTRNATITESWSDAVAFATQFCGGEDKWVMRGATQELTAN